MRPCARCAGHTLRVVVDTNVWVSGLIRPDSPPGRVLEAVATGTLEPVMSWELAEEIVDVLTRPKLARYEISQDALQTVLMFLTRTLPSVAIDVPVRDPDDAPVVSAALAGNAEAIVTDDSDLLADEALVAWLGERGVSVDSPREALSRLR